MAKDYKLRCPRCGSENVNAQVVSEEMHVEKGHHGFFVLYVCSVVDLDG